MTSSYAAATSSLSIEHGLSTESTRDALEHSIVRVANDIVANTTTDREDRLWPGDILTFQTNPLSLAYGACGTAIFLQQALGGIPSEAEDWILARPLTLATYPPGLYVGLAGIARALVWLGHLDRAEEAMTLAYASPLLYEDNTIMQGMAGWGLAALGMYDATGNEAHLQHAVRAGDRLLSNATIDPNGRCWPISSDNRIQLGYGYGTAGIACFLLRLYTVTRDDRFRAGAVEAMEFTLANADSDDGSLRWTSHVGGRILYPYWQHGGAGVGTALVRFYQILGEQRYLDAARAVARGSWMLFAAMPSQFMGMSGIGDFLLDLYVATGEQHYFQQAEEFVDSILCYAVDTDAGLAFPGRDLARLSAEYAYGSSGTAAFLQRIRNPRIQSLDGRVFGLPLPDVELQSGFAAD